MAAQPASSAWIQLLGTLPTEQPVSVLAISCEYIAYPVHAKHRKDGYGVQIFRRREIDHDNDSEYNVRPWYLYGHQQPVTAVAFSDREENIMMVTSSADSLHFWTMNEVRDTMKAKESNENIESEDSKEQQLTYEDDDGDSIRYRRYEPSSRVLPASYPASSIVLDSTGHKIALAMIDQGDNQYYHIVVLDVETGKRDAIIEAHRSPISSITFISPSAVPLSLSFPSESLLLSCSHDRTFKIWSLTSYQLMYDSSIVSSVPFLSLSIQPNSPRFAVGSSDGLIRWYEMKWENKEKGKYPVMLHAAAKGKSPQKRNQQSDYHSNQTIQPNSIQLTLTCQPLHILDMAKVIKQKEQEELTRQRDIRKEKRVAERKKIIRNKQPTTKVTIATTTINQIMTEEYSDEDDEDIDQSILADDTNPMRYAVIGMSYLNPQFSSLLIVTCRSISLVSSHTYFCIHHQRFYPLSAIEQEEVHSISNIGIMQLAVICNPRSGCFEGLCAIASPFIGHIHVIGLHEPVENSSSASSTTNCLTIHPLSLYSTCPVPASSCLNKYLFPSPPSPKGSAKGANKKTGIANSPIMFHNRIKSSGYGATHAKQKLGQLPKKLNSKTRSVPSKTHQYDIPSSTIPITTTTTTTTPVADIDWSQCILSDQTSRFPNPLHNGPINTIQYSPDGRRVLTSSLDHTVGVVRLSDNDMNANYLAGHHSAVTMACWNGAAVDDSGLILTSSTDCTARLWQLGRSEPSLTFSTDNHSGSINATNHLLDQPINNVSFFHADRLILLTHRNNLHIYRYQLDSPQLSVTATLSSSSINNRNQLQYAAQSQNKYQRVFSYTAEGTQSIAAMTCANHTASHLIFLSTGARSISIFDAAVGQVVASLTDVHNRVVHSLSLGVMASASNDAVFLSLGYDSCMKLWDIRTSRCIRHFSGHVNRSVSLHGSISPCGRYIATGSEDNNGYIFDMRHGTTYCHKVLGATDIVTDAQWKCSKNTGKQQLITASYDGRIRAYHWQ